MAAIRLPDHAHCGNCGDPIKFGEEFCSDACKTEVVKNEAKDKKMEYIFYAVGGTLAVIGVISYILLVG